MERPRGLFLIDKEEKFEILNFHFASIMDLEWAKSGFEALEKMDSTPNLKLVVLSGELQGANGLPFFRELEKRGKRDGLVVVFMTRDFSKEVQNQTRLLGLDDYWVQARRFNNFKFRLEYLLKQNTSNTSKREVNEFKIPLGKRIFDVLFSGFMILALSPILLLIGLLIKLESRGPVMYASKRVGAGFKVFDFYKFRSMVVDADARVKDLLDHNQYGENQELPVISDKLVLCEECKLNGTNCENLVISDTGGICERQIIRLREEEQDKAFVKFKKDPRITRVGRIIRKTSLDELPQLFNVLKGDMSIIGNRPLPIYEAEKLTSDHFAVRFLAPAGITGLWQVSKRGGAEMSAEERRELDNSYARSYSLWGDLKILLMTIPAMIQKEDV